LEKRRSDQVTTGQIQGDLKSALESSQSLWRECSPSGSKTSLCNGPDLLTERDGICSQASLRGAKKNLAGIDPPIGLERCTWNDDHHRARIVEGIPAHDDDGTISSLLGTFDRIEPGLEHIASPQELLSETCSASQSAFENSSES
jgi:hypothetical protein